MTPNKNTTSQQEITPAGVALGALFVLGVAYLFPKKVFHNVGMFLQGPRKGRGRKG